MRPITIAAIVAAMLLSSGPAEAAKRRGLHLAARGAKLHAVARLLAAVGRKNVIVSGAVHGELTLVERGRSWRRTLRACAARGSAVVQRHGATYVVLPAGQAAQRLKRYRQHLRKRRRWPGRGRRVDLDFQQADLRNIVRLIGDVSGLKIQGTPAVQGKLSVTVRNAPWNRLLDLLLLAQGLGALPGPRPGRVAVGSLAELTSGKPLRLGPIKPPAAPPRSTVEETHLLRAVIGARHSLASLKLVAIVTGLGRPRALLQPPVGGGPALILTRGSYVGREAQRVTKIAPDGVTLERVRLGQPTLQLLVRLGQRIKP